MNPPQDLYSPMQMRWLPDPPTREGGVVGIWMGLSQINGWVGCAGQVDWAASGSSQAAVLA